MLAVFEWIITFSFFGILARLIGLQIIDHQYYLTMAQENRVKVITLPAERGKIIDAGGRALAEDKDGRRVYPLGPAGSQVLGYVGVGDNVITGKDGLELYYNEKLSGEAGGILVEVDSAGEIVREISRQEPVRGQDIFISLDKELQSEAFSQLAGRQGAVVITDPLDGAVLALASSPGFDPDQVASHLVDPDLPLFNRALGGEYPPGSTFKLIAAAAGLEEKVVTAETKIEDTGVVKIGDYQYANWYFTQYGRNDGWVDLMTAIKRSNDIYFYRLGEQLGIRRLSDWAKWFGVGRLTGIDLPGEAAGLMPDPQWKENVKKEAWYLGDTLITAIGQGNILMTPLQVNQMTSLIAARGKWCRPHLSGKAECNQLDIGGETLTAITSGMVAVNQAGGTAFPFFDFGIAVAGKTGTAEYGEDDKTHAWYTGFSPVEKPQLAVTVLLEGGGEGSADAAPIAKALIGYWLGKNGGRGN